MAHFARLNEYDVVTQVIVVSNEDCLDENGVESEEIGISFCKKLFGQETKWKKTSYNNNLRVRYAGVGFTYNEDLDAFIPPKPFDSWILDEKNASWISPVGERPSLSQKEIDDGFFYNWNEENKSWDLLNRN